MATTVPSALDVDDYMSEPLLNIENLHVRFGSLKAVDGLSCELDAEHVLGLIGPNGAGKTTTLRAAVGLQPVAAGRVTVLGRDVFEHASVTNRSICFTPDAPAMYDALSIEQFLLFIGKCYGLTRRLTEERIDHWLSVLWLTDKRRAKIETLSRGMKQRLSVARSLLPDPHVVLMDEPAAGLDPAGRVEFRKLIASLRDQGKAIIVSSHILTDLAEYCTHIAIMGHGRLLQSGPVDQVAGAQSRQSVKYRVVLAERVGDLAARLAPLSKRDDVSELEFDADWITLEYAADKGAAADLLKGLISAGLPVAEFQPVRPDLEQAYLRAGIRQVD